MLKNLPQNSSSDLFVKTVSPGQKPLLGKNPINSYPPTAVKHHKPKSRNILGSDFADSSISYRYHLREVARPYQDPGSKPAKCGRVRYSNSVTLKRQIYRKGKFYHFWYYLSGLIRCNQIWVCPVCAAAVANSRGRILQRLIDHHRSDGGGGAYMVTATMPHDYGDNLETARRTATTAWSGVWTGPPALRLKERYDIVGYVRGLEVTHGRNGWHPHIHAVLFTKTPLDNKALSSLESDLYRRWADRIERRGYRRPSRDHGLILTENSNAGEYVSKITANLGAEISSSVSKAGRRGSRTVLEILRDIDLHHKPRDIALFSEYVKTIKGARQLTWSRDVKRLYADEISFAETDSVTCSDQLSLDLVDWYDKPEDLFRWQSWEWDNLAFEDPHFALNLLLHVSKGGWLDPDGSIRRTGLSV